MNTRTLTPNAGPTPHATTARKRPDGDRTDAAREATRARHTARCLKRGHAVTRAGNRARRDA